MSYQVLARKWRPQVFTDVIGQEHVLLTLKNALSLGRIHHAYLFSGTSGIGKTTIARILAKSLNCETSITVDPCRVCNQCRDIAEGFCLDLIEIDAASRTKVEDIRDLLENAQYTPARSRFKIYLIDEVHMLSRHSFNALLKTLEEPPPHVKFLLATTEPQKLPVTIVSRCLHLHLTVLDTDQICMKLQNILQDENIHAELRALELLAQSADGSMRNALSLTDQAIVIGKGAVTTTAVSDMLSILDDQYSMSLIESLVHTDGAKVMELLDQAAIRGIDWEGLLIVILGFLHRMAIMQLLPSVISKDRSAIDYRLKSLASTVSPTDLQLYYQIILLGRKELQFAPNQRMGVEMTLLRAMAFQLKEAQDEEKTDRVMKDPLYHGSPSKALENLVTGVEKKKLKESFSKSLQNSNNQNSYSSKNATSHKKVMCIPDNNKFLIKRTPSENSAIDLKVEERENIPTSNQKTSSIVNSKKKTTISSEYLDEGYP
ncbi:DNA polymerase III subunit tau, isoform gamma [Candidatus Erwinia haradaeae]|uniref:DNA polymerase III subunit gamma/tau n=1 Tax=Candidatus Erwinia haradaeae TaxID=1922217 RepID=A0A451DJ20_9GAMM|nr:DNA polymerase III subunit gamma/tau [Candidatus Erwinia haradaeae]VFP86694.1 DNA polymerase III subunit tau, isoform gamma [Candidatus Erwinia haradaeae]